MDMVTDILIVGTGVSGLYAALNLSQNLNITMISKGKLDECNTSLAQGGIAVARGEGDIDSFINDTLKAGKYENNIASVRILAEESIDNIKELLRLGMEFEMGNGGLSFTREGAHSINRIAYYEDITGKKVEETLLDNVFSRDNINLYENCEMIDILKVNNTCVGIVCVKDNEVINIYARTTILATGGIGGIFKNSTNERILTGDSIGVALRNEIKVSNLDYIQFHPTALFDGEYRSKKFLISESLRGEGGKLINNKGMRFVDELLPRDVVTKCIYEEMRKSNSENVYLDISFMDRDFIINRFPNIYKKCLERGIDICKSPIPVAPTQHYFMGGIDVDLYGQTSMKNLYAFGEVSCTGVHGANRLASNSLLEALVFSRRGATKINNEIKGVKTIKVKKSYVDIDYYRGLNSRILTKTIYELRGDIRDELVISRGYCKKSS
ncbi:L-aspartate oxidase [Clostridium sardiniense]|uniref:L-aspartate oxidase n=1 Tax=Clostridium sardiniense TaxID=29369 RepID=UPI003D34FDA3